MPESQSTVSFDEARSTLRELSASPYDDGTVMMDVVMALEVFMRAIKDHPEVPNSDLLRLLEPGGLIAEFGARCLYLRTGRDDLGWQPAGANGLEFVTDRADWAAYLEKLEAEQVGAQNP